MSVAIPHTVENICFQIAQLDAVGRQEIFERVKKLTTDSLVSQSKPDGSSKDVFRISDLWGVGAEIWQGESVNEYIRKERDSWD
jgi:hypothetical protein